MNRDQQRHIALWRQTVADANAVLAEHHAEGALCSCLRTLPCPVAHRWMLWRNLAQARLDHMTAATMALPIINTGPAPKLRNRRSWLWPRLLRRS